MICRDNKKPSVEVCDNCVSGPCWGHDCTLGSMMSMYMYFGHHKPPVKTRGGWTMDDKATTKAAMKHFHTIYVELNGEFDVKYEIIGRNGKKWIVQKFDTPETKEISNNDVRYRYRAPTYEMADVFEYCKPQPTHTIGHYPDGRGAYYDPIKKDIMCDGYGIIVKKKQIKWEMMRNSE